MAAGTVLSVGGIVAASQFEGEESPNWSMVVFGAAVVVYENELLKLYFCLEAL